MTTEGWLDYKPKVDGGSIRLTLPRKYNPNDYDDQTAGAEEIFRVLLHEWAHIKDFQDGTYVKSPTNRAGRRIAHDKRPCEVAAEEAVKNTDFLNNAEAKECIHNLAVSFTNE